MTAIRALVLALLALGVACTSAHAQQVKYEKYKLDNGLTVILHEDHSLPIVAVNTWYRVGAKDEPPGRSGFAHLFEHLMFMGTQRVPNGDFDKIMESGGGSNNASTAFDRTNYFSSGPASLLPTLLWLDADRMEDLGRTMNQEKLDRQRDVVRNEIRQVVENAPYGKAGEDVFRLMYPDGHPYHHAVYGDHADLEAATVENVQNFFATYYVPNNASLVVAGDFDPAKVKPLIASLFGTVAHGNAVDHKTAPPAKLPGAVHKTVLDKVQLPMLKMVWHSPSSFAEGDAEMDLTAAVLSQGKNSRLYKRLVFDDKIAVDVSASQDSSGLGSLFEIDVTAKPDVNLDQVKAAVDEELAKLLDKGPTPAELEERKNAVEMGKLSQLQSLLAVADKLNEYEYQYGEPNSFQRDLDRYRKAAPVDVRDWDRRVLSPDARLIMRVLPEEAERAQTARDQRPQDLPPVTFTPHAPESFSLSNGIKVLLWTKPELPLVAMNMVIKPVAQGAEGSSLLYDPAHAGLPELTAKMLDEGAGDLDSLGFASAVQSLGARFSASTSQDSAEVFMLVLKRNADKAARLMADAVRRPRLAAPDWDRVKSLHLEELKEQDDEPTIVASRVALRELFGDASAYAWPVDGTPDLVAKYSLEDVKRQYASLFRPEAATILIAGAITADDARTILDKAFGDWKPSAPPPASSSHNAAQATHDSAASPADHLRVYLVDRPDAVQTVIRFVSPGPAFKNDHRAELRLLNTLLGGAFTSRLNQNLREAHGYTYGAGSRFVMDPSTGYFLASSSVRADVTGESLKEFLAEFARLRSGDVSPEEASKGRETMRSDVVQSFEGLSGLLRAASETVVCGVPFQTIGDDLVKTNSIDAKALNSLAAHAVPLDQGVLVLVGDRAKILPQLSHLKLTTPKELDVRGDPVAHPREATNGTPDSAPTPPRRQ